MAMRTVCSMEVMMGRRMTAPLLEVNRKKTTVMQHPVQTMTLLQMAARVA